MAAEGVYRAEKLVPFGMNYGSHPFSDPAEFEAPLKPWGCSERGVYLDLETTGLSVNGGSFAFLAGLGIREDEGLRVVQIFLSDPEFEGNFISALENEVPEGCGFVTYNGKAFDLPMLISRSAQNRCNPAWLNAPHLDLLPLARGFYSKRLSSCSLSRIETDVLGVVRSGADIPGSLIPGIYAHYLATGDASELSGVFYHNAMDIVSLAALLVHISQLMSGDGCCGEDLIRRGEIESKMGFADRASESWRSALNDADSRACAAYKLAFTAKRRRNFREAREMFRISLEDSRFELNALVELAKLEEHRFKDFEKALSHAERALKISFLFADSSETYEAISHRIERLKRKIGGDAI